MEMLPIIGDEASGGGRKKKPYYSSVLGSQHRWRVEPLALILSLDLIFLPTTVEEAPGRVLLALDDLHSIDSRCPGEFARVRQTFQPW